MTVSTHSQRAQIRAHLEAGRSITPLEALDLYGCFRLGARIHELKGEGLPILSERPEEGPRYAIYSLVRETAE